MQRGLGAQLATQRVHRQPGVPENGGVGEEVHAGARPRRAARAHEGTERAPLRVRLREHAAVAMNVEREMRGEGVDAGEADPVQAPRRVVAAPGELPAGVEGREDQLRGGNTHVGVQVDGDAAPVVFHREVLAGLDRDGEVAREPRACLVHSVLDELQDEL
jgi:hypothetical protein